MILPSYFKVTVFAVAAVLATADAVAYDVIYRGLVPSPPADISEPYRFKALGAFDQYRAPGYTYSCVYGVTIDGQLIAWGIDQGGLFGPTTRIPPSLDNVKMVSVTAKYAVALLNDGRVVQFGNGMFEQVELPPENLTDVVELASGDAFTIALKSDGSVVAWGDINSQDLGGKVVGIAAAGERALFAMEDGTVRHWGYFGYPPNIPENLSNVVAVAASTNVCLALRNDGTVVEWGSYGHACSNCGMPDGLNDVLKVVSQQDAAYAIKNDGTVVAWGAISEEAEIIVNSLQDVSDITVCGEIAFAIHKDGSLTRWYFRGPYSPGDALYSVYHIPVKRLKGIAEIASGYEHVVALKTDGTVVAWGANHWGQVEVPEGLSNVVSIWAGGSQSAAMKSNGELFFWGYNEDGQSTPPEGLGKIEALAAGFGHYLAIKEDGSLVAWGANDKGQIDIPEGLSNIVSVAAGGWISAALDANGYVYIWGDTFGGQKNGPFHVPDVVSITASFGRVIGLKNDGTVTMIGETGDESPYWDYPPEDLVNVESLKAGEGLKIALLKDGSVRTWGSAGWGSDQLPAGYPTVKKIEAGFEAAFYFVDEGAPPNIFYPSAYTYDFGGGWKYNSRGFFYDGFYPFLFDWSDQTWHYIVGETEYSYYYYNFAENSWYWASYLYYPNTYKL